MKRTTIDNRNSPVSTHESKANIPENETMMERYRKASQLKYLTPRYMKPEFIGHSMKHSLIARIFGGNRFYILATLTLWLLLSGIFLIYNASSERAFASHRPAYTFESTELFDQFSVNETAANQKFLGKTILVTGKVKDLATSTDGAMMLILNGNESHAISCSLEIPRDISSVNRGDVVTLEGVCAGKLQDVELIHCRLVNS